MIDVLVVGAGPTGLMMATQLVRHGARVRIIDQQARRTDESRAIGVQARTLELFDQLGLAEHLLARATHGEPATFHLLRGTEARLGFEALAGRTRFPSLYLVPQPETEGVLLDALATRRVAVERSVRLVDFTQDAGGVAAEVVDPSGRRETIRSRYLVGCDGADSRVREVLGIPFEGATYPQHFVLADVRGVDLAPGLHLFLGKRAACVVAPMGALTRLIGVRFDRPPPDAEAPVTHDELRALLQAAQAPVEPGEAAWTSRFHVHHRATRRYAEGRAFLAGDACHIHTPVGAQGMNTGLQDATNLAWKLALAIRGAPPALLDSYASERQRVGELLVRTTDRVFGFVTSRRPLVRSIRDLVAPALVRTVLAQPALRARLVRFVSQLDIRYHPSRFVRELTAGADDAFRRGPPAGCRVPDLDLDTGTLYARLRDPALHVLALGACDEAGVAALERRHAATTRVIRIAAVPASRAALERMGVSDAAVYVLRPDGHVGFRSYGPSLDPAAAYLDELTGAGRPRGTRTAPSRSAPTAHPRSSPAPTSTPGPHLSRGRR